MLNSSSHKKQEGGELVVIYDIGNASVGGALVELHPDNKPNVIYASRQVVSFQKQLDPDRLMVSVKNALDAVSKDIQQKGMRRVQNTHFGGKTIQGIYCVLSSSWYISKTHTVVKTHDTPVEIDESYLDDVIQQSVDNFVNGELKRYTDQISDDLEELEKRIIHLTLNGYQSSDPFGKTANRVEATVFYSMIPTQVIEMVHNTITTTFNTERFHYNSFVLASFSTLRNMLSDLHLSDFIFMDVSGELTDVSLIKNDRLIESVSFPIGKNFLIRSIAEAFNTESQEAISRMAMYGTDSLHTNEAEKIEKVIATARDQWIESFTETVESLSDTATVPHRLFFVADADAGPVFKKMIEQTKSGKGILREDYTKVVFLDKPHFQEYYSKRKGVKDDVFLAIATVFANTIAAE